MKIDMKQRIIGIVVIIALAVILIPLFVSQYQHDAIVKQAQIPQQPEAPNVNSVNQLQALNNQITEQAQDKVDWQSLQPASGAQTSPTQDANLAQTNNAPEPSAIAAAPAQPAITAEPSQTSPDTLQANPEINTTQTQAIAANPQPQSPTQANSNTSSSASQVETTSIASNETPDATSAPALAAVEEKPAVTKPVQPKAKNKEKLKSTKLAKSTESNAYLVQLGNFSSKKNASVLKNRLEKYGFHPSIEENHGHFRVLVGPATSHEKAAQKLQLISQKVHVSGFLVKG